MKSGIYAVIQARRGSSRFPDKVLADICGKTMLQRVIERVQKCELLEKVILATTVQSEDQVLLSMAKDLGVEGYAGSVEDVLDRYYQCSRGANTIVRITADCPLVDHNLIGGVIQYHLLCKNGFTTNRPSYPSGVDVEVVSSGVLERAWKEARSPYGREHVVPYILEHPELFKIGEFQYDVDFPPHLHWSVDYPEDLTFIRSVYEVLGEHFTFADLIASEGVLWSS